MANQHIPIYQQDSTVPPPRRRRLWPYIAAAALVLIAVAGGGTAAYLLLHKAGTFDSDGSLVMTHTVDFTADSTTSKCKGTGAYSDITAGASVTVRDAAGKTVALGTLGNGATDRDVAGACEFPVIVMHIPEGSKFYTIQVGSREQVTFARSQMDYPTLKLG